MRFLHGGNTARAVKNRLEFLQTDEKQIEGFLGRPYIRTPDDGTPFYRHNHQPAVTWCDNGDLLAIWFSCDAESGREMVVLSSRLRKGEKQWSKPQLFFKVPDRNMTGCSLMHLPDGRLMHVNGVSNAGDWKTLAMSVRFSTDNGMTWTAPELVNGHTTRHQVIAGPIVTSDGSLSRALQPHTRYLQ